MFIHVLPISHGSNVGSLKVHSHRPLLQVSAFSGHPVAFWQEQAGWFGILRQILPSSQGSKLGAFALHVQVGGYAVVLQVSAVSKHPVAF